MKCPKCHYLSFEPEVRCRNCGYDLELAETDLALKADHDVEGPLVDLALHDDVDRRGPARKTHSSAAVAAAPAGGDDDEDADPADDLDADDESLDEDDEDDEADEDIDEDDDFGDDDDDDLADDETDETGETDEQATPAPAPALRVVTPVPGQRQRAAPLASGGGLQGGRRAPSTTAELPLFVRNRPDAGDRDGHDRPLVDVPASPSPPLAVRRRQESGRSRARPIVSPHDPQLGPFERDLLQDLRRLEQRVAERARADSEPAAHVDAGVSPGVRLTSAGIDLVLLGGISAFVVWATLRLCDLDVQQASSLPVLPLFAFLLLVASGYLLMFTVAGGQTVGKMLTHIRVVAGDDETAVGLTPRQAAMRALLTVPSVLALGAGFVPALLGQGPAIHDRLSHTRVVRT